jgi:hypothetical protein
MSLDDLANKYKTDKGTMSSYDKSFVGHGYSKYYEFMTKDIRFDKNVVLELGVYSGGSLKMWSEWFPNSTIYGYDINDPIFKNESRIKDFKIDATSRQAIDMTKKISPNIIIDDASHRMDSHVITFENLWPFLKSGGLYIIEDLHTCYIKPRVYGGSPTHNSNKVRTCEWYSDLSKALNYNHYAKNEKNIILGKYPYISDIEMIVSVEKLVFIKKK